MLGLALVAERVSTRIAGILAGAPQNVVIVYFFVGRDMGVSYVAESAPHAIAAFTATIGFVLAYYAASLRFTRFAPLACACVALAVFFAIAALLVRIPFTPAAASVTTAAAAALATWLLRRAPAAIVQRPVRLTLRLLLARTGFAAALIVAVIELAEAFGTRWAGLFAGFPTMVLATVLIIHATYGPAHARVLLRNFPIGVISIILYILSVPLTFPALGVAAGTIASLALSVVYLMTIAWWTGRRRAKGGAG